MGCACKEMGGGSDSDSDSDSTFIPPFLNLLMPGPVYLYDENVWSRGARERLC